jgi:hypothetical protein
MAIRRQIFTTERNTCPSSSFIRKNDILSMAINARSKFSLKLPVVLAQYTRQNFA